MDLSRRDLLALGGATLAAASLAPRRARAQTPKPPDSGGKRGGVLSLRTWDPPHFDPFQTISYKTHIALSFTHSRLLKHKAGPGVPPGTFPVEGDLAESWTQPSDTTYVFKLRRGVRWHGKPPVNGRQLTADAVKSEGAVLLVPGRPGGDRNMDRAPGGRRSFRRSPEAGSLYRDRALDARAVRAQRPQHVRAEPELFRAEPSVRGRRGAGRRS